MDELEQLFAATFREQIGDGPGPEPDDVVFGRDSIYGLESMDTLRFASALLPVFGDRVYDLKVEHISTLRSIHDQLNAADR